MVSNFQIQQGATLPWLELMITQDGRISLYTQAVPEGCPQASVDPNALDLSDVWNIQFNLYKAGRQLLPVGLTGKASVVTDADRGITPVNGIVQYKWGGLDTNCTGLFYGQFIITFKDRTILKWPYQLESLALEIFEGMAYVAPTPQPGPTPIPANNLLMWLDASGGVQDNNFNPANIGSAVLKWCDRSGGDNFALQSNQGNQPLYITGVVNNLPVVRFDGSTSFLNCKNIFPTGGDYSLVVAGRLPLASYGTVLGSLAGGHKMAFADPGQFALFQPGGPAAEATIAVGDSLPFYAIVTMQNSTLSVAYYVNGAPAGTGVLSFPNTDNTLLIGQDNGGSFAQGDIAEIIVYGRVLSAADITQLQYYLGNKYNIV